jgi:hypothetical protein
LVIIGKKRGSFHSSIIAWSIQTCADFDTCKPKFDNHDTQKNSLITGVVGIQNNVSEKYYIK